MTSIDSHMEMLAILDKIRAELRTKEDSVKRQREATTARMVAMLAPGRAALKKKREDREKRAALARDRAVLKRVKQMRAAFKALPQAEAVSGLN